MFCETSPRARPNIFYLASALLFLCICNSPALSAITVQGPSGIRVQGSGSPPEIAFACCDKGIEEMQSLFNDQNVVASLNELHAEVAVAISDFSPDRAAVVRRLNQAGIPVVAWIVLAKEEGYFLNADNSAAAMVRIAAFEKWTAEKGLKWVAVGLDIEPNFAELAALKAHRWHLISTLIRRSLDGRRIERARDEYSRLIAELQSRGYAVQTYQMPYLPAEHSVHSTILDRLFGTVDVHGNREYLMLYTNVARPIGAAMIWSLGRKAQGISVGSTDGEATPGVGSGPLDWDEFSRDLIVASHYSRQIGVYDLEGCVRHGFLPLLKTMDWSKSVVIPADSVARAERLGLILRTILWTGSHILYFISATVAFSVWFVWRRRVRMEERTIATRRSQRRAM
jgi:hypothetical protein